MATRSRTRSRDDDEAAAKEAEEKEAEATRYRQAANDALQQLDWAIGYLHGIRKTEISRALAKNRTFIRRQLMGESEQPVPTEQTGQT